MGVIHFEGKFASNDSVGLIPDQPQQFHIGDMLAHRAAGTPLAGGAVGTAAALAHPTAGTQNLLAQLLRLFDTRCQLRYQLIQSRSNTSAALVPATAPFTRRRDKSNYFEGKTIGGEMEDRAQPKWTV